MAHAYTPGLKVSKGMALKRIRRLPLPGTITVQQGQKVNAETVVARTELPGQVTSFNVASLLGIQPDEIYQYMLKKEGDPIAKDEIIASSKGLFGLFKSQCKSPITGTIESISKITGLVMLREPPIPVEINAYVDGLVTEIIPNEGVVIQTYGTFIQGIFGIGGEAIGELAIVCKSPDDVISPDDLNPEMAGKVLVVGSIVTSDIINKAIQLNVKGIISGGIDDSDLRNLLGYELGVAITGSERLGITIIITEGFGRMAMANRTFNLLRECEGKKVSINGATQIRAGVIRPEAIIPDVKEAFSSHSLDIPDDPELQGSLNIGTEVRIIREPHFGELAEVTELPVDLQELETEAKVRVLKVRLRRTNDEIILPRANVEIVSF
ncbi:TPA: hypothetical protein ENX78_05855 [Candidatus Poribacteria bacterium]|nr:hypothetical protein [Candidatus Poribacteria bacterium]